MNHKNRILLLIINIFSILIIASLLPACNKDDDDDHDMNEAAITIHSPVANAYFHNGDTVEIAASVVAEMDIHGYEIYIRNTSMNDSLLFQYSGHDHNTNVTIGQQWVVNVSDSAALELKIEVILDHDDNKASEKVNFSAAP